MKKFALFLAPLMAISLLTNCGSTKQYTVTFDLNGGTSEAIPTQTVKEGEKATKPDDPTRAEGDDVVYMFKEWQLDNQPFDFATPITSDITLKADWNIAHKYTVAVGTCEHLSFTTTDGKDFSVIKAIEGEDFTFKMKAINEEGSTDYLVPSFIDITVNGTPLEPTSSPISRISDFEADVTIKGSKINGNIVISGSAAIKDHYTYQVFKHDGLKDIPSGSKTYDENISLTLEPLNGYEKPKDENILILFDNVPGENPRQWVSPAEKLDDYCTYNESNGLLTIKRDHIKNNICIVTRAHNFKLLESLSWDKINQYSLAGWAPYIFYLGEEKTIQLKDQNIKHKIRIIDFNHDELSTSTEEKKQFAGITFEFANLLSDKDGYSLSTFWNTAAGNTDYLNSNLRKALDGSGTGALRWYQKGSEETSKIYTQPVVNMFPEELRNNLKAVKKYVATGYFYTITNYNTKVFALTHDEMTKKNDFYAKIEGTTYQYYKDHDNKSSRIKRQVKVPDNSCYWLVSPYCPLFKFRFAFAIYETGDFDHEVVETNRFAVAPAFCI